jgi:hypothetical protein
VKTGERGKSIAAGGAADELKLNDTTIIGILARAKKGAAAFRADVTKVYADAGVDAPTLVFRSFTLITTKTLNPAVRKAYVDSANPTAFDGDDNVAVSFVANEGCFALMEETVHAVLL